ncbi:MAG: hypothetical protein Q8933_02410 [Bacteroidota bacterium]|nr:hypothetical protein [Bacteroidota bacterium]MDP4190171.1 hypothetical protein [Bacteroidota bacterium]MDP4193770.1 hypothetical protein [Bacteroidota bacterium]
MISLTQNIAGLQQLDSLKPSVVTVIGKALPAVNSFVEISVLGKSSNIFRLLIDGNVFQSKLPVNLLAGESFLAKVISTDPFTLSLDNLLSLSNLSELKIAQLLSKLNIKASPLSDQLFKAFVSARKVIVKSRFEKLLDIIEKNNLKLDDSQLQFLINVLDTNENSYENLSESFVSTFKHSSAALSEEILNCATDLLGSHQMPEELKTKVKDALLIRQNLSEEESVSELLMVFRKRTKLQAELIQSLNEALHSGALNESVGKNVFRMIDLLTRYIFLKANNCKVGIYNDFFIAETEDGLQIFEYSVEKPSFTNESYGFHLKMKPDLLGQIQIDGYFSGNNLFTTFISSDNTAESLKSLSGELVEKIKNGLNINVSSEFCGRGSIELSKKWKGLQNINVSV